MLNTAEDCKNLLSRDGEYVRSLRFPSFVFLIACSKRTNKIPPIPLIMITYAYILRIFLLRFVLRIYHACVMYFVRIENL